MRLMFDRSAFHGDSFQRLVASELAERVARGQVSVFHNPVFLDETVQSYGSKEPVKDWQAHLAYAVKLCNGGIFLSKMDIWQGEIVRDFGPGAPYLHPPTDSRHYTSFSRMLGLLQHAAESGDLQTEWRESAEEREDTHRKKNNQKGIFSQLRKEVAVAVRERRVSGKPKDYPFSEMMKSEFVGTGREFMSVVDEERHAELADQWSQNPKRYPFYSAFVEGALYAAYYAMIENNRPLDRNAQADYEQLSYLLWADVIVSNDANFFHSAFQALWAPHGKRLVSAEGLDELLKELD